MASRQIVGASASVVFSCTIKSRRWRAIMEKIDKGCNEFCIIAQSDTVTRTAGILINSQLKAQSLIRAGHPADFGCCCLNWV